MDDRDRLVAIYLQDHLAGSVAALELVERAARANAGNELGSFLTDLHGEISADKETLLATCEPWASSRHASRTQSRGQPRRRPA